MQTNYAALAIQRIEDFMDRENGIHGCGEDAHIEMVIYDLDDMLDVHEENTVREKYLAAGWAKVIVERKAYNCDSGERQTIAFYFPPIENTHEL
jgi:hypothetical protein